MRTVYKYPVRLAGPRTEPAVVIPNCVKVALFGPQGADGLFVWAEVREGLQRHKELFVFGTGDGVEDYNHVASCQDGPYVWHLYEKVSS